MTIEFGTSDGVFVNRDVLTDRYNPDKILERENQKVDVREAFNPIFDQSVSAPDDLLVYGSTGVGKTVAMKKFLSILEIQAMDKAGVDVEVVWQNVKGLTSHKASIAITNELAGDRVATPGQSQSTVYETLEDEIKDRNADIIVFALDEIDSLGLDDDLLYKLARGDSHDFIDIEDTKTSIVGISNSYTFMDNLSSRVRQSLRDEEIMFPEYNAKELKNILHPRAEKAFKDDAIDEAVISLAASLTTQEKGSARRGLDILRESGKVADQEDADKVKEEHVYEATNEVEDGLIKEDIESLSTQSQLSLYALAVLELKGASSPRIKRVHSLYKKFANRVDVQQRTQRTIQRRLQDLALKDFVNISTTNQGVDGGRYNNYSLALETEMVVTSLEKCDRINSALDGEATDMANQTKL